MPRDMLHTRRLCSIPISPRYFERKIEFIQPLTAPCNLLCLPILKLEYVMQRREVEIQQTLFLNAECRFGNHASHSMVESVSETVRKMTD